ncbi:MAG TPA: hypothetical protein DEQ17_08470 [Prevotella sp.]|nr:hypothetical protein [Prevotella sp.]
MRKIFYLLLLAIAVSQVPSACKMAPSNDPGDTVAASVFAPLDTAAINRKARAKAAMLAKAKDSVDIFYIGSGSTKQRLQLVSYPSRRDTLEYGKARHIKRSGSTDVGSVVRVAFWVSGTDSLVKSVEQQPTLH